VTPKYEIDLVPVGEPTALEATLSPLERVHYATLRLDKQRREHLAGRLAAKRALAKLTGYDRERFAIVRSQRAEDRGRPEVFVDGKPARELYVSISHTRALAAAGAAGVPIGIDIELVEDREASFEQLIATREERATFEALSGVERRRAVTLLWCTKEALAKRLGVGLSRPFQELDGRAAADRRLVIEDRREHALAIVIG
jgi:phosphopantetheinyl transferase